MNNIAVAPKPINPVFTDKIIVEVQDSLIARLSWLTHAFGRCQRLSKVRDKRTFVYPGIHIKSNEYLSLLPNQELGNYSFFEIEDPQSIDFNKNNFNIIRTKFALVFWVDLSTIFVGEIDRNTEELKAEIVKVLTRELFLKLGRLTLNQISEKAENIFKGYSLTEIESQYLMQPFAGFRFEGELLFQELCTI